MQSGFNGDNIGATSTVLKQLTRSAVKAQRYAEEVYSRECLDDLYATGINDPVDWALHTSYLLIKPDGVVARCAQAALEFLSQHSFTEVGATAFTFKRHSIRELWRYQLNVATMQRLAAIDLLLPAAPSVVIMLRHATPTAAETLSGLKGSALLARRSERQLRSFIEAKDGLLNFVHTPDDAADMVRELGVLLDRKSRRQLLMGDCGSDEILQQVYTVTPEHNLNAPNSLERLRVLCAQAELSPEAAAAHQLLDTAKSSSVFDWERLFEVYQRMEIDAELWDRIIVACSWSKLDRANVEPLF